jgi:hypothetical protein
VHRGAVAAAVAGPLLSGLSPAPAAVLRADGLSFPVPIPDLGQALELVGHVSPDPAAPFPMDPAREYTWSVYGPVVHAVDDGTPGLSTRSLTFGVLEIRSDPFPDAVFPPFPPNGVVPSAFRDGTVELLGVLTALQIQDVFGIVTATGVVEFASGASLGSLGEVRDWSFRAAVSAFDPTIPPGFGARWSLQLDPASPVGLERSTWGGIKALYR